MASRGGPSGIRSRGLDENNVEKKFRSASGTQESIQSLSLWVIHHKAHHEKIVEIWFKVLKKSQIPHRLVLFYLCNDIVQNSKRKHAVVYKDAFKEVLRDAVLFVKDSDVRPNIERIFNIWGERNIYDVEFTDELIALLNNTKVRATVNSKLLAEFKPEVLMEKIKTFHSLETEVQRRERHLSTLRLDSSNLEAVRQLKDKSHGREFTNQFEDCCSKLEEFVNKAQEEVLERTSLIEMLEQSELFYDAQFGEAKIVANAYKNFGTRISNLRKKLEVQKARLPSKSMSPLPSPSMDAPSPENSPMETDDIVGAVDMDLSDDEERRASSGVEGANWRDSTKTTRAYPEPISSITSIHMKPNKKKYMLSENSSPRSLPDTQSPVASPLHLSPGQQAGDTDGSAAYNAITDYLPGLALGAQTSFMTQMGDGGSTADQEQLSSIPTITDGLNIQLSGGVTPVKDEGSSTPVQDEHDHDQPEVKPPAPAVANPIEFLTQLINQGQKSSQANFFQGLNQLTQTVQAQHMSQPSTAGEAAGGWGPWSNPETAQPPSPDTPLDPNMMVQPQQPALVPYQQSPLHHEAAADQLQGEQQAQWPPSQAATVKPPGATPETPQWSPWQSQSHPPAVPPPVTPNMPLHQPPAAVAPTFQQPPPQPPSPELTIPSTPPVHPVQHPPPGPPPPFMVDFSQPPPGLQQAPLGPETPHQPPSPQTVPPPSIPHPLDPSAVQQPSSQQLPTETNQNPWGYTQHDPSPYPAQQPTGPAHIGSPRGSGSSDDYSQQTTPRPLIRPRGALRQRTYSHHTDSTDPEEREGGEEGPEVGTIPTIGGSNRRSPIFPPRPPSQPPTPKSAPPHLSLQHTPNEAQQEFIEKLKRKSSLPGTGPATASIPPKPNFHLNRRTLTAIPAQSDTESGEPAQETTASDTDVTVTGSANGTGEDRQIVEPTSENSMQQSEEEPSLANFETLEIKPVSHRNASPMPRGGPPPPFHGQRHRDFEPREPFHEHERRNSFHERDRRNSFERRDYDIPPPPRGVRDPYYDDYRGAPVPPPPASYYDHRDPYMRPRPPMKRPLPPPHYDRGGYFPRY